MKVVILCGGMGTRLREETEYKPKPMVEIGGKPILWHIMKTYAHHGHKEFVLCLGYKGNVIRDWFLNYQARNNDFTVELGSGAVAVHGRHAESDWKVTLVETGLRAMTGARLYRVRQYLDGHDFALTYGDGVARIDLGAEAAFHRAHDRIGTLLGVRPQSRFGELVTDGERVESFEEKPVLQGPRLINGGYFIFKREFLEYLTPDENLVLEQAPLRQLARDDQLRVFHHDEYWQCLDTYRDFELLNREWDSGQAPWRVWE
jgi:glucose-1-phosphate cytidylyltransferase